MQRTIYLGNTFDKEREVMLEWFRNHIKASLFFHYMQSELNPASASHICIPYSCQQPQALHTKLSSFIYLHQVLHCPSVTGEAVKELITSRKRRMFVRLIPNISCCKNQLRPPPLIIPLLCQIPVRAATFGSFNLPQGLTAVGSQTS